MIDAIVIGKLHAKPEECKVKGEVKRVTALVKIPLDDNEHLFAMCEASRSDVCAKLMAMDVGDAVTIAGELRPRMYEDESGRTQVMVSCAVYGVLGRRSERPRALQNGATLH